MKSPRTASTSSISLKRSKVSAARIDTAEACLVRFNIHLHGSALLTHLVASVYEGRRSGSLLKIKTFYDAEAIVVGHAPGKRRNKGITGALKYKTESGKVCLSLALFGVYSLLNPLCSQLFNVGSGMTDKIRKNPPKIGTIITYRFQELTRDGVPR